MLLLYYVMLLLCVSRMLYVTGLEKTFSTFIWLA